MSTFKRFLKAAVIQRLPVRLVTPHAFVPTQDSKTFISLSMQRSGQHAVLHWICCQMESVVHLNYCTALRQSMYLDVLPKTGRVLFYRGHGRSLRDTGKQSRAAFVESLRSSEEVHNRLYSFENVDVEDSIFRRIGKQYDVTFIIILRDPYNWLASTLAHALYEPGTLQERLHLWKKQVKQSLSLQHYLPGCVVSIDFGRWFSDRVYREQLCSQLGLDLVRDDARLNVPKFGGGSSFKGTQYDGRAPEMDVMNRWQRFTDDPTYRACFEDEELIRLTEEYFQMAPPF